MPTVVFIEFVGSDGITRQVKFAVADEEDLAFQIRNKEITLGATAQYTQQPKPIKAIGPIGFRNASAFLRR